MQTIHIVVIEDDTDILELIEFHLQKEGFETTGFLRPQRVVEFVCEERVDLMIVDRNLPGMEGSELVKALRKEGFDMPIIFLTAKDRAVDVEEGFLCGGDDYMVKPFSVKELILRIKALLKRSGKLHDNFFKHRDIVLDLLQKECRIEGMTVELTPLEFRLLYTFILYKDRVLEKEFLREEVWGEESITFHDKTLTVALNRLKKKIDPACKKNYITSVRGIGYKMP